MIKPKNHEEIFYIVSKQLGIEEVVVKHVIFNLWHSIKEHVMNLEFPDKLTIKNFINIYIDIKILNKQIEKTKKTPKLYEKYIALLNHYKKDETKA